MKWASLPREGLQKRSPDQKAYSGGLSPRRLARRKRFWLPIHQAVRATACGREPDDHQERHRLQLMNGPNGIRSNSMSFSSACSSVIVATLCNTVMLRESCQRGTPMLPARLILLPDPSLQRLPTQLAQPSLLPASFLLPRLLGAASPCALPMVEVKVGLLPRGLEVAEASCPKGLLPRRMRWRRLKGQGASASLPRKCFCRRDFRALSPEPSISGGRRGAERSCTSAAVFCVLWRPLDSSLPPYLLTTFTSVMSTVP